MAWVAIRALRGETNLGMGDLAAFYQAFNQGQVVTRSLLSAVSQIFAGSLFIGNLFEFLALEPTILDPPEPVDAPSQVASSISFEDVSFSYPESDRAALAGFDLEIGGGQVAAIVGPNGAGKSTLIKLICRLYDPHTGRLALDGIDIRRLRTEELRRAITVLFQEPVHFNDTVAVNIALGDLAVGAERAAVEGAARAAGADVVVAGLPDGYDTLLGKLFAGGTDLSVGEWQRIALARAFLRQAPLMILDEPTSAMDPWAEADWLRRFRQLAEGKTAVIITHRFTTARFADVIHVMVDGRVLESGTHEELLQLGGRYAESWRDQMRQAALE
jgi:ATP-binding cassette subfamily B protein